LFAEPLNGTKDDKPVRRSIAGHVFDPLSGKCSCGKVYSDVSAGPRTAVGDESQSGVWCHQGCLTLFEWQQIQDENERIFACARS
jgi:hypothetical protein